MLVEIRDGVEKGSITRDEIVLLSKLVLRLYDNRARDIRPWDEYKTRASRFYALDLDEETNTVCFGFDPDQLSDKAASVLKKVKSLQTSKGKGRITFSEVRFNKKDQYIVLFEDLV